MPSGPFLPFSLDEIESVDVSITHLTTWEGATGDYLDKIITLGKLVPFHVRRATSDKLEAADLVGRLIWFEKTASAKGRPGWSTYRQVAKPVFEPENWSDPEPPRDFALPADLLPLAKNLARRQIEGSTSYIDGNLETRQALSEAAVKANLDMLQLLQSREPLTLDHINKWNRLLLSAVPDSDEHIELIDGVLRGTEVLAQTGQGSTRLVLSTLNIPMECADNCYVFAARPNAVPEAMNRLVSDVNSWDANTEFSKPGLLVRRFIRIHPYYDGCGRTGKIVADYALMKTGFGPAPAEWSRRKYVLFTSDLEALKILRGAYAGSLPPPPHWTHQHTD